MERPRERLDPGVFPGASSRGDPDCAMAKRIKSLSLNKFLGLNPPLKKGDLGGFALDHFGKIPPTPLCKGGKIICGQALK